LTFTNGIGKNKVLILEPGAYLANDINQKYRNRT